MTDPIVIACAGCKCNLRVPVSATSCRCPKCKRVMLAADIEKGARIKEIADKLMGLYKGIGGL